MLATPSQVIPTGRGWLYQVKHDGYRMQAHWREGNVHLWSRNGLSWYERLPRIAEGLQGLRCASCILDGEAVIQRPDGRDDFHAQRSKQAGLHAVLMAFDLLELDGRDLGLLPLVERRHELARLLAARTDGVALVDALDEQGPDLFRHACELGLEGLVCKRKDSLYRSGSSLAWLKAKCPNYLR
ncbi:RNA ligase family protein [Alsobacter soli]|nr:RNA ligase family protein [Alsobacter soli]